MRATTALLAALLVSPALAQPYDDAPPSPSAEDGSRGPGIVSGAYVGLRGSMAFNGNHDQTWTPTAAPTTIRSSYATGGGGSLVLGTYLPLNLRLELEALFQWQPVSTLEVGGIGRNVSGNTYVAAPFLNLFWDVPMPYGLGINPFIGMGVGAAYARTDIYDAADIYMHNNNWNLAYSFMGGVAMPLDEGSRLSVMYRWMQVRDANHNCAPSGYVLSSCLDTNINSQSVDLGYEMDL